MSTRARLAARNATARNPASAELANFVVSASEFFAALVLAIAGIAPAWPTRERLPAHRTPSMAPHASAGSRRASAGARRPSTGWALCDAQGEAGVHRMLCTTRTMSA